MPAYLLSVSPPWLTPPAGTPSRTSCSLVGVGRSLGLADDKISTVAGAEGPAIVGVSFRVDDAVEEDDVEVFADVDDVCVLVDIDADVSVELGNF